MTNTSRSGHHPHAIADIERDTGLSKDTLRVWERRYGFPNPVRDALGERRYDDPTLLRLRHIRRLLDAGHRAGQVVPLSLQQLLALNAPPAPAAPLTAKGTKQRPGQIQVRRKKEALPGQPSPDTPTARWMSLLRQHNIPALRAEIEAFLQAHGLLALLRHGIAPMNQRVGQSWLDGELAVFEEHLYTEAVQALLRQAIAQAATTRRGQPPRVLITTVPGEAHALGLLMAESVLVLEGCETLALGTQTPLMDIVSAARACAADVVALGFTAALNPRDVRAALTQLRAQLPAGIDIWTGGQCPALQPGARAAPLPTPHLHLGQLDDIAAAVRRWRAGERCPATPAQPAATASERP